ncbi:MAG: S9 family peptidase [Pyrinomonadaceae bacterium]
MTTPPIAKKEAHVTQIHGHERIDNYHWLRDRSEKKDKEILDYLNAENAYTDHVMKPFEPLVERINEEILSRIKQTDLSVPYKYGDYWYSTQTIEGKQYPLFKRGKDFEGTDAEVILDQNELAEGHEFYAISQMRVCDDGKFLKFGSDTTGYRQYTLQIKNLETGEFLPNRIERVVSSVWSNCGGYIFYVQEDAVTKRNDTFWRHEVESGENVLLRREEDVLFNMWVARSRDKKMLFLNSAAATMDEFRFLSTADPLGEWTLVRERSEGHEYGVDHWNGELYISTNEDAEDFRVVKATIENPGEDWVEFIPHKPGLRIEDIDFFKNFAVVSEREEGLEYLRVLDLETGGSHRVKTPESVYTMEMAGGNLESETDSFRYGYSSMITPDSTFEYDTTTGESRLLKQQEVLGDFDSGDYETRRVWATARDGVKVPVSLVMKKGVSLDGTAPLFLYAYGSYGYSMTPYFSIARLSLLDRGMIYAIAHIRGGSELGEKWRQDGRMFKKLNTFHDFIDCADWLSENGYTSPDRIVASGGSAGGLLMGAVANMSPESFHAIISAVPFVDVINTMLDDSLPLTTQEWIEWGNPNELEAYEYMMKYSPYDNIGEHDYPEMLYLISLWDSQVPYWEGAKYVAKVRDMKTNDTTVLLKTNMGGGHGGSSGRYDRYKEIAFEYAYALSRVGITE